MTPENEFAEMFELPEELVDELIDPAELIELRRIEDEAKQQEDRRKQAMTTLAHELTRKKDRVVQHKSEIEQRWMQDERQYWGFRMPAQTDDGENEEAPPIDNKTQSKVDIASARIGDMMFPTNDRNWAAKATPQPTDIDGNPIDRQVADKAVQGFENRADDLLRECDYPKHGRQAIFDACKLGVGIIKGPVSRTKTKRVVRRNWQPVMDDFGQPVMDQMGQPAMQSSIELQIVQETQPGSYRVDPWMFFTGPCRSMDECEGVFELHLYPRTKLSKLAEHPGFIEDAVREAILKEPKLTNVESSLLTERQRLLRAENEPAKEYAVWEYHGPIESSTLQALGYEVGDDPLDVYTGEVWFCGAEVLKIELNAILGDNRVPYYVLPYKRDDADLLNSWGIPRIMRDDQRSIDILWEAMQHNSKLCSGPQIAYWPNRARIAGGKSTVDGPTVWEITDENVENINQVIQFQNIQSSLDSLIPMYQLASQNANENTALPALAEGEASQVQRTLGEAALIMNAQNIVQRRIAHAWDDDITIPMLTRYYWWEMEYGDNDEIKVEMEIDPRGASYLMVKDMQTQHALMAYQMVMQDQRLAQRVKLDELDEIIFNFLDVPTDRIFKTAEEVAEEQQNNPEAQMQMQAMQLEMEKAQAELRKINAEAMKAEAEAQAAGMPQDQGGAFDSAMVEYQNNLEERQTRLMIAQMSRDARLAEVAANKEIKVTELMSKLNVAEQNAQLKQVMESMRLQQRDMESRRKEAIEGTKAAIAVDRKNLRAERQELMKQNLEQGHDTF